ncbi:Nucleotidyl transferase [Tangfeifania diversioriginum]|uniref:Nucleotidyl transferase n=1 Tax=Tangfeifania diversioriginum TaxID=1168035 RepID=A0A1M6IY73_9BACT|nr:nucleotidyltransferase family protein [Tangfeifania diversioriginum]SHJ39347.1 Nucleotidyl transferase [Tangfeifania diversioriginum]
MKAMIFAAGLGSRLKEETQNKPKALVEIGGKTLLQHAIEKLKKEGISEIVVNVHHFADLMINYIESNDFGLPVTISDETHELLETGGGLKKAAPLLTGNEPVLLYNTDILTNLNIQKVTENHKKSDALATLVVRKRKTQRYFKFDQNQRLVGWINKETGETKISLPQNFEKAREMAFSGIHVISPEIFNYFPRHQRFSMTTWYLQLAKNYSIKGFFDTSDFWMDVGKPEQLNEARKNSILFDLF